MHENHPRRARLLVLILVTVVALFAAACGDSETENGSADSGAEGSDSDAAASDAAGDTADTASGEIEGSFLVSGSSTVYPIVLEQAEAFGAANRGVAISV
jgi:ABC-type phosphate transport system substrate-binding protein